MCIAEFRYPLNNKEMLRRCFASTFKRVGFIGIGNMGSGMTANLLKNGYQVKAFDINAAAVDNVVALGATRATSPQDASRDADAVVLMLPNTKDVERVVAGPQGIQEVTKRGALIVDSSTISPMGSRKLAADLLKRGIDFIDAPVSGGTMGAKLGTLTFMVGCEEPTFQQATPLLKAMGKNIIYCGKHGAGLVVKLCNNLSLAMINIATCEAMNLGVKMGLDPKKLYEVMSVSTARSWPMDTCNPVPGVLPNAPSTRGYEGGFGTGLVTKDVAIALEIAQGCGAQTLLGEKAHELYKQVMESGAAGKDFGFIYQLMNQNRLK